MEVSGECRISMSSAHQYISIPYTKLEVGCLYMLASYPDFLQTKVMQAVESEFHMHIQ